MATDIKTLAQELLNYFDYKDVPDPTFSISGKYRQYFLRDDAPEWLHKLMYRIHKRDYDMLPDDYKYEFVVRALTALTEYDDPYEAELEPDVYTNDLMRWMYSHSSRMGRVDEAIGRGAANLFEAMTAAQAEEMNEVLDMVREELEKHVESEEE
jgi:hypothetical protein